MLLFIYDILCTSLYCSADSAQDECLSLSAEAEALKSSLAELQAKLLQVYYSLTFFTHSLLLCSSVILVLYRLDPSLRTYMPLILLI